MIDLHRHAPELPTLAVLRAAAHAAEQALLREHPLLDLAAEPASSSHVAAGVLCSRLHELEAVLDWYIQSVADSLHDDRADGEVYPF